MQLAALVTSTGGAVVAYFLKREADSNKRTEALFRDIATENNSTFKDLSDALTEVNLTLVEIKQQSALTAQLQQILSAVQGSSTNND